ncbi:MAG: outer membrane protein assembly factor BamE [Planctomycetota bacterium]|nr:outer membrane protein assembly factor BamE [Planctomycetota bacterium]
MQAPRKMASASTSLFMLLAVVFSTPGCQSQSRPGFETVEPGMSRQQVRDILGTPSSTYEREVDSQGAVLRVERWQYGDNLSTLATGILYSDLPSDSVWVVFFDEQGRVTAVQVPERSNLQESERDPALFEDPFDPAIPSRSR